MIQARKISILQDAPAAIFDRDAMPTQICVSYEYIENAYHRNCACGKRIDDPCLFLDAHVMALIAELEEFQSLPRSQLAPLCVVGVQFPSMNLSGHLLETLIMTVGKIPRPIKLGIMGFSRTVEPKNFKFGNIVAYYGRVNYYINTMWINLLPHTRIRDLGELRSAVLGPFEKWHMDRPR
jgi:hypothetical protein